MGAGLFKCVQRQIVLGFRQLKNHGDTLGCDPFSSQSVYGNDQLGRFHLDLNKSLALRKSDGLAFFLANSFFISFKTCALTVSCMAWRRSSI